MRFFARVMGVALLLNLLPAGPALAARTVTITGGGWGHGMGMSQYGAYGRAKRGDAPQAILEHYYSGSQVTTTKMPSRIRVGLLEYRSSISASSSAYRSDGGRIIFKVQGTKGRIARGNAGANWRVEPSSTGGLRLYKNGNRVRKDGRTVFGDPAHPLVALFERYGSLIRISEKGISYAHGRMEFGTFATNRCNPGHCLRLVLSLPMQKYLYGLGEVPFSWPGAALRSQVIAARTYAYEKTTRSGQHRYPCDCAVYDSTLDQVYSGDSKRESSGQYWDDWTSAVDDTKDQVILHKGAPIQALYSSSSGGHTENNENVWGGTPLPYLRGVPDAPDNNDANPNFKWSVDMSYSSFQSKLNSAYGVGNVEKFTLVKPFGVSGRVTVVKPDNTGGVRIVGSKKTERVSGWSIRSTLALKDSLFRVQINYQVSSEMVRKYRRLDRAPGAPTSDSYRVPIGRDRSLGRAQDFEKGRMTWRRSTDKTVWQHGPVLRKYNRLGRERSTLGMPTSDIWGPGSYVGASYVNGLILWSKDTGAHSIRDRFRKAFTAAGGADGHLGLPTTQQKKARSLPGGGKLQRFQSGSIYLNPTNHTAFALWGDFDARYRALGQAAGVCGYPVSSVTGDDGVRQVLFQNGSMHWTAATGLEVDCS
ncbi:MAG TPA: SpoIID/LytB domain-containing protein [Actinomycetota bacterium]|nr:SpoIID/LytB domain-containing protein [Actinomycetota bacterium]